MSNISGLSDRALQFNTENRINTGCESAAAAAFNRSCRASQTYYTGPLFRRNGPASGRCVRLMCLIGTAVLLICAAGCGEKCARYTITAEGTVSESGVIDFAGMDMNVYKDKASNPCGDCPDQPVSVYAGTGACDVISAMAERVKQTDDIWEVSSCSGNTLVLTEKEPGTAEKDYELSAPAGLVLTGKLSYISASGASSYDSAESAEAAGSAGPSDDSEKPMREITNSDGSVIQVPEKAERIAAVYGPSYEAAVILGAEDRIAVCADVQFENFPWALKVFKRIKELPHLDNVHSSVSFEELQKYSPDLVLTFNRPNELKQLRKAGIAAVNAVTPQTLGDSLDMLDVYAAAIGGDAQEHADEYRSYFNEKLSMVKAITGSMKEEDKPSVYYAGIDLLTTYGKYSDICEVIEAAGGRCVTSELEAGNHTQIGFEQLAAWNPEYIFIDHGGMNDRSTAEEIMDSAEKDSRYRAVRAVSEGNVYLTPSGVFYWDMGLQKILLVMNMAKILHPEEFAGLDMNEELREFYLKFFDYELTEDEARMILDRVDTE